MALTSVLIVDDEPAICDLMTRWLNALGLPSKTAANAYEALAALRAQPYELAIIDVMLPGHDGLWLAHQLRRDHPQTAVVLATAYTALLESDEAPPIADLLIKPFQRDRFALAVERGRRWREQMLSELDWQARLSSELQERIGQLCAELSRRSPRAADEGEVLLAMSRERAPDVAAHSERVAQHARLIACEMGADGRGDLAMVLESAGRFHDIGKLAIPDALLMKPSLLAPGEDAIMRQHVEAGAEILARTRTLQGVAPIVFASHEWFGGGGYPRQLAKHAIPLASRILAIADSYDAMTHDRQYRVRLDSAEAVAEMLRCCPAQFDPDLVTVFLGVLSRSQ
jgi:response regulator RpfG family c-di-GMP phosphodiesterase